MTDPTVPARGPAARDSSAFDHRDPGTGESDWAAASWWNAVKPLTLEGVRRLVVVAAHPDDETLGAGGVLAQAAGSGIDVAVLVISAGEGSHPRSSTITPTALAEVRRVEVRRAVAVLAPGAVVRQLEIPDGRLAASVEAIVAELAALVGSAAGPGTLLIAPWRGDRHPDHEAASLAAERVAGRTGATLLEYPVWAWHWAGPDDGTLRPEMLVRITLSDQSRAAKERALAEHASQLRPLSDQPGDEAVVQPGFLEHFRRPIEVFVVADRASLDQNYFDDFYGDTEDPWGFHDRWYEERKRAVTLASLPRRRFGAAFEPGCSIGVLTAQLAQRCDHLLAADISPEPLAHARRRLAGVVHVEFRQLMVPRDWPAGSFDLVVLSEIGYYCSFADLSALTRLAVASLTPDGVLVLCHWRHPVPDYPLTGDQVHDAVRRESGLSVLAEHVEEDFRLDVLVPPPAVSVARAERIVS